MPRPGSDGRRRLPREYFLVEDPARLPDWRFWEEGPCAAGHDVSDRQGYLTLVYRLGSTPNGVFGAKIHWNTLRWALAKFSEMPHFAGLDRAAVLRAAFPDLRVVAVTRRDRSARRSPGRGWPRTGCGSTRRPAGACVAAPCGPAALRLRAHRRPGGPDRRERTGWRQLYDELGLTPCQVIYEELSTPDGYEPTIRGVLAHLGLADYQGPIPAPRTAVNPTT